MKLPKDIIELIKAKDMLLKERLQGGNLDKSQKELKEIQCKIDEGIMSFKLKKRKKLRTKLLKEDPTRKRFWRFLKQQSQTAGKISAVLYNNEMVFDQENIEEAVLDHFGGIFDGKREPIIEPPTQPPLDHEQSSDCSKFESEVCAPYTMEELDEILDSLPNGKAAGVDNVPNELLKNSNFTFRLYLLTFLNKIMDLGEVPEELNTGKCMLIYKVLLKILIVVTK